MPVAAGTFFQLYFAVSKAEILLRVLEERLDAPAHPVRANYVCGRCVNLVRGEIFDRVLLIFIGFFFGNDQLHVSEFGDGKLLGPDVVEIIVNFTLSRVDALCQRIDAHLFLIVGHLPVASDWADPVVAVGFDVFDEVRIVGKPRIEEVGVRGNTYLFFKFGDNLSVALS